MQSVSVQGFSPERVMLCSAAGVLSGPEVTQFRIVHRYSVKKQYAQSLLGSCDRAS